MIKSWDLFDTLITRRLCAPDDVFFYIEKRVGIKNFLKKRKQAEALARKQRAEVSLEEIYQYYSGDNDQREELMGLEIDLEISFSCPVLSNLNKFSKNDLVISDMYLSREVINRLLNKNGIPVSDQNVFLSSELGVTKANGKLYDHVLSTHDVEIHTGDNYHADKVMASASGISSEWFSDGALLNKLEKGWRYGSGGTVEAVLAAGVIRAARLKAEPSSGGGTVFFSQVVAPLLISYCEWVLAGALAKGIRQLIFMSRDGQLLKKICDTLIESRSLDITTVYFYGSRQALHLPGFNGLDEFAKSWLFEGSGGVSVKTVQVRAGLHPSVMRGLLTEIGVSHDDSHMMTAPEISRLAASENFKSAIQEASDSAHAGAMAYIKSLNLKNAESEFIGIVDVGWNGRIQRSLSNIIQKYCSRTPRFFGFYIGVFRGAFVSSKEAAGFIFDANSNVNLDKNKWVVEKASLIEHFLAATHSQVTGYTSSGRPTFSGGSVDQKWQTIVMQRHAAVLNCVQEYEKQRTLDPCFIDFWSWKSIQAFRKRLAWPSKSDVSIFLDEAHVEDHTTNSIQTLVTPLGLRNILFQRGLGSKIWPEASIEATPLLLIYKLRRFFVRILTGWEGNNE